MDDRKTRDGDAVTSGLSRRQTLVSLAAVGLVGCPRSARRRDSDVGTEADTDLGTDSEMGTDTDVGTDGELCEDRTGEQVEGPFYPGEPQERVDITGGKSGVALLLDLQVVAQGSCDPIAGAEVDVWCADAVGAYSGYANFGTVGQDFLRGQQITDEDGMVRFTAIVPGAYPGRSVHLHVKVRAAGRSELTTQVYLDDALVGTVLDESEYADGGAQTTNAQDAFYREDTLLSATGSVVDGYVAEGVLVV